MKKRSIVVTGGTGYVGRELVRQLAETDRFSIHVLDSCVSGEHRPQQMRRESFELHRCDIRDTAAVGQVMRAVVPEIIFHLAAVHYIPACEAAPGDAVSINVAGTVNLLDAAPPQSRFVFASSAAVYRPSAAPHVESDEALGPMDIYGHTKLQGENFVRYYHAQRKLRGVIVRLFNVVGPGETNPHLVPAIVKQLSARVTRVELGNLFPRRDYIDVGDAAQGFRLLADANTSPDELLISNLGTGVTHSVEEVVSLIGVAAGTELEIRQDRARMRAVDRPMLRASTERLRVLTDWVPQTTLAASLAATWAARFADGWA